MVFSIFLQVVGILSVKLGSIHLGEKDINYSSKKLIQFQTNTLAVGSIWKGRQNDRR